MDSISADFPGVNMLVADDVATPEAAVEGMESYLKAMEPIEICAERVSVTYEHADLCVKLSEDSEDVTNISDKWAEMLLGKISVKGQEKVRWEWYEISIESGDWVEKPGRRLSEEEDAMGYWEGCSRKTLKIMSV